MRMSAWVFAAMLGLAVLPNEAAAELTWTESIQLWWARGSLGSAMSWRIHYAHAEHGIENLIGDFNAAVMNERSAARLERAAVEARADVEFQYARLVTAGWSMRQKQAFADVKNKIRNGAYFAYVTADLGVHRISPFEGALAYELLNPTNAGRDRARREAARLYEQALEDWSRHLDHVKRAHAACKLKEDGIRATIDRLEAKQNGGPPTASTPSPVGAPRNDVSLLGVR
jgi:hypothetical protein